MPTPQTVNETLSGQMNIYQAVALLGGFGNIKSFTQQYPCCFGFLPRTTI